MVVGKNFSLNNVTGRRRASDFYQTPYSMTEQLLDVEPFPLLILEPAAGQGAIVRVLRDRGFDVSWYDAETDFLRQIGPVPAIVTNPPYSRSFDFILHAKRVVTDKFAFLLPLSYLHGKRRHDEVYSDRAFPLKTVYVFVRYSMLSETIRDDGRYGTGMMVYAWFVWERGHPSPPIIRWIDNDAYVIGSRRVIQKTSEG